MPKYLSNWTLGYELTKILTKNIIKRGIFLSGGGAGDER
jgi:hypothetical protein